MQYVYVAECMKFTHDYREFSAPRIRVNIPKRLDNTPGFLSETEVFKVYLFDGSCEIDNHTFCWEFYAQFNNLMAVGPTRKIQQWTGICIFEKLLFAVPAVCLWNLVTEKQ